MGSLERQSEEILALRSTFDDLVFQIDGQRGKLSVHPDIPNEYHVSLELPELTEINEIKYLPPVTVDFSLPTDYPAESPPICTVTCTWLSTDKISEVHKKLLQLWSDEHDVILFSWIGFLQQDLLTFLDISKHLKLQPCNDTEQLEAGAGAGYRDDKIWIDQFKYILSYNNQKLREEFDLEFFTCDVCFKADLGSSFMRITECGHVFCKECVKSHCVERIQSGTASCIYCLEDKCSSEIHPSQILELVGEKVFQKYDQRLLETSLSTMQDIVYCPRPVCQAPSLKDPSIDWSVCSSCSFAYCHLCRLSYHGLNNCTLKDEDLVIEEYLSCSEERREEIYKKYGKKKIRYLAYEKRSVIWKKENTKNCPKCDAFINKAEGCNKVVCIKCDTKFCWLCFKDLSDMVDPYKHFMSSLKPSKCFGKLYDP